MFLRRVSSFFFFFSRSLLDYFPFNVMFPFFLPSERKEGWLIGLLVLVRAKEQGRRQGERMNRNIRALLPPIPFPSFPFPEKFRSVRFESTGSKLFFFSSVPEAECFGDGENNADVLLRRYEEDSCLRVYRSSKGWPCFNSCRFFPAEASLFAKD